jgi:hypothetical protein
MIYTTYDSSGEFLFSVADNGTYPIPANSTEGTYESTRSYFDFDQQQVVDKSEKPSNEHVWNADNKTWIVDLGLLATKERTRRNQLLFQIDRVNPAWHNTLTTDQQAELATYRQSLLDVPQQADFPSNHTWPTKPTWL